MTSRPTEVRPEAKEGIMPRPWKTGDEVELTKQVGEFPEGTSGTVSDDEENDFVDVDFSGAVTTVSADDVTDAS